MAKFLFQLCGMCGRLALSFRDCSRVSLGSAEPESGFTTNLVRIFGVDCVYGGEKIGYPELPFCCRFLGVFFPPSRDFQNLTKIWNKKSYRFIKLFTADFTHPACGFVSLSLASSLSFK